VLPATEVPAHLCARYHDGTIVAGEANIPRNGAKVDRVWLVPAEPPSGPGVLEALLEADAIVLGPGSLYTSIVPNLLVDGVPEAIARSEAIKIYVCNLMTQTGETPGYSAADHVRTLQSYVPPNALDVCVVNTQPIGNGLAERYLDSGSDIVGFDSLIEEDIRRTGVIPVAAPLLEYGEVKVRHDSLALARLVVSLARGVFGTHEITLRAMEGEVTCAESSDISVPGKSQAYW
jgi:uncharacterized cofD-like protein